MNKKQRIAKDAPRIRLVAPTAVLASGLLSTAVWSAPGDLDPSFGNVGRVTGLPGLNGELWALEPAPDDDLLFSGCGTGYYNDCLTTGFLGRLNPDGSLDKSLSDVLLGITAVFDLALQPDGKAVAMGHSRSRGSSQLTVFRLLPDGTLDPTFGTNGVVQSLGTSLATYQGTSLVLEPDGRITLAGQLGDNLVIVRLLASGALDTSFGTDGAFTYGAKLAGGFPKLVRVQGGGYRATVQLAQDGGLYAKTVCRVLAVTPLGAIDPSFGNGGLSGDVVVVTKDSSCSSMVADSSGRTVVAGSVYDGKNHSAFVARLQAGGSTDPGFDASAVASSLESVSAMAIAANGQIALAGQDKAGLSGALVARLQADGRLDEVFGRGGLSRIALVSEWPDNFWINDLQLTSKGAITLGGGAWNERGPQPFVARLLGDASRGGPGLLGVRVSWIDVQEAEGHAVVNVERTAGKSGAVSVSYAAEAFPAGERSATAGTDFTPVQGQLNWADGDDTERQIVVPILPDSGAFEFAESFAVRLGAAGGGAGLAATTTTVSIRGDGYPGGVFSLSAEQTVEERWGKVDVLVNREDYATGPVSVLVAITGGSAKAGADYVYPQPVQLSWADQEYGTKTVTIALVIDQTPESPETLVVSLSEPKGGAVIGPGASATVTIVDEPIPPPGVGGISQGGGGGGGNVGALFAFMSGCFALLRWRRRVT
jgi:uncharacterized delta-60 repeat protein